MLDEIAKRLTEELTEQAIKSLLVVSDVLTDGLATESRERVAALFTTNDERFQNALQAEKETILWQLHGALATVASVCVGRDLGADQAVALLLDLATNERTRRRFRALINEASTSTDDRIAMLAVGYFVGAAEPSIQERLDWALRSLFPSDVDTLGVVAELQNLAEDDGYLLLTTHGAWDTRVRLRAKQTTTRALSSFQVTMEAKLSGDDTAEVDMESLRALGAARCIEIVRGGDGFRATAPMASSGFEIEAQSIRLAPLGKELHANLAKVDWREIAKRRRDT